MKISMKMVSALMVLATVLCAQIPKSISYQGILTDDQGIPVADGTYDIEFNIYDDIVAVTPIWSTVVSVTTSNGMFATGISNRFEPLDLPFDMPYFLGVGLEGDPEMTPRVGLTSSSYSFHSQTSDTTDIALGLMGGAHVVSDTADQALLVEHTGNDVSLRVQKNGTAIGSVAIFENTNTGNTRAAVVISEDGTAAALSVEGSGSGEGISIERSSSEDAFFAENSGSGQSLRAQKTGSSTGSVAVFENTNINNTRATVVVSNDGTAAALSIEGSGSGQGVSIERSSSEDALFTENSGSGQSLRAQKTGSSTGSVAIFENTNTANTRQAVVITNAGTNDGLAVSSIGTDGSALVLNTDNANNVSPVLNINANEGSGAGIMVEKSTTATGNVAHFSNLNANSSGSPLFVFNAGTGTAIAAHHFGSSGSILSLSGFNTQNSSPVMTVGSFGSGLAADFNGNVEVDVLQIAGGSDIAEPFDFVDDAVIDPGTVMVIDIENPGELKMSQQAYDRRVAGIVSGAGGVKPGLTLQQDGIMEGKNPVALAGRVYCKAEAISASIEPGDLLTTSNIPGHAMKASALDRSHGSVLGKAMTGLDSGTGLVLVLVNLQ